VSDLSAHEGRSISRFEATLRRRAAHLGRTVEQVLEDGRIALRQSSYPGPECLNPYEVEQFFVADLREDRVAHVEKCPMCAALLDAAQPTDKALAQFIDNYRVARAAKPVEELGIESPKSAIRRPLSDLLWVEGPVIGAWGLILGIGILSIDDATMHNVLSMIALQSLGIVCGAALLFAVLTGAAARWLKFARGASFQRFGGAALGGMFAALVVFYGAKLSIDVNSISSSLETAQSALLTALVQQHRPGRFTASLAAAGDALELTASPDGNVLSASSTRFPGKLTAQKEQKSIEVYWDRGRRRSLATIREGTLERGPNGEAKVLSGTEEIPVKPNLLEQTLGNGTRVLALVPTNDDEASKVFPVDNVASR
jgi:hypothetical protein